MTINKENEFYPQDLRRLKILVIIAVGSLMCFFIYRDIFFQTAKYKFTVAEVIGQSNTSKATGIKFFYLVESDTMIGYCYRMDCKYIARGKRLIVKYFVERPEWQLLYPLVEVPKNVISPAEGWAEIPDFKSATK